RDYFVVSLSFTEHLFPTVLHLPPAFSQSACVVNCAIESELPDDTPLEVPEDGLAEGALPRSEEDEPLGAEAPVPLVVSLPDVPVLLPLTPVEPPVPVVPDAPAAGVRVAERGLDGGRRLGAREDETEILPALGQRHDVLADVRRDRDLLDAGHRPGRLGAAHGGQAAGARDRNHHHARRPALARQR